MKVIVVLPAYNAQRTLRWTIDDIPFAYVDELILVDDCSRDETWNLAESLRNEHPYLSPVPAPGKLVFYLDRLPQNHGYGGNQKRCYDLALERGADIVVMLHPDYQYDPKLVRYFVELIKDGYFDVMLGSRIRSRTESRAGGMPAYKYYANRALTLLANVITGRNLSEWHTGMRAYRREVLETVTYEDFSNDFIFDVQMLVSIIKNGFTIGDISVPVRYFDEASSIDLKRSLRYGLLTLWEIAKYLIWRVANAQFTRFVVSGLTSVFANLAVYALLLRSGLWYLGAAIIAYGIGAVVSFSLHKYWTFKEVSSKEVWRQLLLYGFLLVANSLVTIGILALFVEVFGMDEFYAALVTTMLVAVWSFFLYRKVVFVKRARNATISPPPHN